MNVFEEATGLRPSQLRKPKARVGRNNWVTDVYGNKLTYGDMGPHDLAAIEQQVRPYGAVLLHSESTGNDELGLIGPTRPVYIHVSPEQVRLVQYLASQDTDSELTEAMQGSTKEVLPALCATQMAVIAGGVLLNPAAGFSGFEQDFYRGLEYMEARSSRAPERERDLLEAARSLDIRTLSPSGFIIETARSALTATGQTAQL